jgi:hypothetical protein
MFEVLVLLQVANTFLWFIDKMVLNTSLHEVMWKGITQETQEEKN